jgi:hypothetical protein
MKDIFERARVPIGPSAIREEQVSALSAQWDALVDAARRRKTAGRSLKRCGACRAQLSQPVPQGGGLKERVNRRAHSHDPVGGCTSKVVGIDLGAATASSFRRTAYRRYSDPDGNALGSIVSADDKTIYVGREAQRRLLTDANRTVYSVKRFMGKGLDDIRDEARLFPFRIAGEAGGVVRIGLGEREFTPPEISAFILL